MANCLTCNDFFQTEEALHAHCRDKADHPYCTPCERLFVTFDALDEVRFFQAQKGVSSQPIPFYQHLRRAAVHQDGNDHQNVNESNEGDEVDEVDEVDEFDEVDDFDDGFDDFDEDEGGEENEEGEEGNEGEGGDEGDGGDGGDGGGESNERVEEGGKCDSCDRNFANQEALIKHLTDSSLHNWCFICSKDFSSSTALAQVCLVHFNAPRDLMHDFFSTLHLPPMAHTHSDVASAQELSLIPPPSPSTLNLAAKRPSGLK
jgi:hypothetical protein